MRSVNLTKTFVSLVVLLIVSICAQGQETDWYSRLMQLKVGESTNLEVERAFGVNEISSNLQFEDYEHVTYRTPQGMLHVFYSTKTCSEGKRRFSFSKGTVVGLFFSSTGDNGIRVSDLNLDLSEFQAEKESDTPNWYFSNKDLGLLYIIYDKKTLVSVQIDLSKKQKEMFSCQEEMGNLNLNLKPLD